MGTRNQNCPTCSRALVQRDEVFTCAEHGDWVLYGTRLLVRPPTAEALRHEVVTMPWEQRLPLAARAVG